MSIYMITAIPLLLVSLTMLVMAAKRKQRIYFNLGLSLMLASVINFLVGLYTGNNLR
ncbi:hypothetical protein LU631_09780 [Erwinia tracheiphila]|nr:hypothetical protein [Erwinia tracheiphila]UIA82273.1 hypothetical protein LU604_17020 [Erwinia tracheiphila]UIA89448.1 hypothetical protein LU631_09780 [Erwinia tracheiphila]UIA90869.1 hypothetical protein LU632_16605 [Erwinia tracheiphila]UIA97830.1 hypothetical protein LU633_08460 [Erwinia tracheiphila]